VLQADVAEMLEVIVQRLALEIGQKRMPGGRVQNADFLDDPPPLVELLGRGGGAVRFRRGGGSHGLGIDQGGAPMRDAVVPRAAKRRAAACTILSGGAREAEADGLRHHRTPPEPRLIRYQPQA